jgi:hypothetical protein
MPIRKTDALLLGHLGLSVGHPALDLHRAAHSVQDTCKLCQEAVAGVLHNPAPVLGDLRINQLLEMRF